MNTASSNEATRPPHRPDVGRPRGKDPRESICIPGLPYSAGAFGTDLQYRVYRIHSSQFCCSDLENLMGGSRKDALRPDLA